MVQLTRTTDREKFKKLLKLAIENGYETGIALMSDYSLDMEYRNHKEILFEKGFIRAIVKVIASKGEIKNLKYLEQITLCYIAMSDDRVNDLYKMVVKDEEKGVEYVFKRRNGTR